MTRNNKLLLGILAFIVSITIGYAVFTQTVTVSGTATASGTFNMMITNARVKESSGVINPTVNVSADKQSVSFSADKLEYPGAYVTFEYTLKNAGTINSMYKTRELSGTINGANIDTTDENWDFQELDSNSFFASSEMDKLYFEPNDTSIETFTIIWNPDDEENDGTSKSLSYTLSLNFAQVSSETEVCDIYSLLYKKIGEIGGYKTKDPETFDYFFDFDGSGLVDFDDAWYVDRSAILFGCDI